MSTLDNNDEERQENNGETYTNKIKDQLLQSKESLTNYSEYIASEREELIVEVKELEKENTGLFKRSKELEINLREKKLELQEEYDKLGELKEEFIAPMTDETTAESEIKFLEQKRGELIGNYKNVSDTLFNHITDIGNSLMDMDFVKGEITTSRDKLRLLEGELPLKLSDMEYIEEKIKWSRKALNDLYKKMEESRLKSKIFYYDKTTDRKQLSS